jgi:hypothetical protein
MGKMTINLSQQEPILEILLKFNKENKKTKHSELTKDEYAEKFAKYQKSDLENLKTDIEYSIDKARNSISFLTFLGIIGTNIIIVSAVSRTLKFWLGFLLAIFFAGIGINVILAVENDLLLLHILKKAFLKKSKISESMTGFQEWNDPEEDIYNAES